MIRPVEGTGRSQYRIRRNHRQICRPAGQFHALHFLIVAQGGRQNRNQLRAGELAFRAIGIDVVLQHRLKLGCIAGLPGTQNNAQIGVVMTPQPGDQIQSGGWAFHDHINDGHGQPALLGGDAGCVGTRVGLQPLDRAIQQAQTQARELGRTVHFGIIVNDQHTPGQGGRRRLRRLLVKNGNEIRA
jgi:hypothetical protein